MNKKDLKILQALDADVRSSFSAIGRKTRLSKEVVQYRIKQLEKNNTITEYWAIPRIDSGSTVYKVLIKNKSLGLKKKEELVSFLTSQPSVAWMASVEGSWDFIITSVVNEDASFSKMMIELQNKFGTHFKDKQIMKTVSAVDINEKYLYDGQIDPITTELNFLDEEVEIDDTDKEIISVLLTNSRSSFAEIGKKVGLTAESISYRFKKIMKNKLISKLKVRINHDVLGLAYYHLFISLSDYGKKQAVSNYFTQLPSCVFIMNHIGVYDMHVELVMPIKDVHNILLQFAEMFGDSLSSYELLKIQEEHQIRVSID